MQLGAADDGASQPAPPAPRKSWRRLAFLAALALGLCGLAFSAAEVAGQALPRRFTAAQQRQIEAWEIARRWRALPEGTIFPATVTYKLPSYVLNGKQGMALTARRLGVSAPARCAKGAGSAAARILDQHGCTALLRATYADASGSMVATVGVAVLPDGSAAAAAQSKLASTTPTDHVDAVRSVPVTGTLASHFDDAQRQLSWNVRTGPYVLLATAGYADGRPRVQVSADPYFDEEMTYLDQGLAGAVSGVLGKPPATPVCPGAPGC
jgi:hypothetical protein